MGNIHTETNMICLIMLNVTNCILNNIEFVKFPGKSYTVVRSKHQYIWYIFSLWVYFPPVCVGQGLRRLGSPNRWGPEVRASAAINIGKRNEIKLVGGRKRKPRGWAAVVAVAHPGTDQHLFWSNTQTPLRPQFSRPLQFRPVQWTFPMVDSGDMF